MRFAYLDGIRGVAALFVLARHWDSMLGFGFRFGHLAVDLFFMLSGFVIAHAYDGKLRAGAMSSGAFMALRFARLYPVYLLSLIVAMAVVFGLPPAAGSATHTGEWIISGLLALAFVPFPVTGYAFLFPMNTSVWSLFAELLLNWAYAAQRRFLSDRVLLALIAVTAVMIAALGVATGTIDHGYRASPATVVGGLARATFGIALGLLMYRHRGLAAPLTRHVSPWAGVALVTAVMMFPQVPGYNVAVELAAVFVVFPLAIALAAAREPAEGWQMRTMVALGIASYPIYLLHGPVGKVLDAALKPVPEYARAGALAAAMALVLLSLWIERHLDIPARQWLRTRLLRRTGAAAA